MDLPRPPAEMLAARFSPGHPSKANDHVPFEVLVTRRTNLRRRHTRIKNKLQTVVSSPSPVRKYLEPDLRELEFIHDEINLVLEAMRKVLEEAGDEVGLNELDKWSEKFDRDSLSIMSVAGAILESPVGSQALLTPKAEVGEKVTAKVSGSESKAKPERPVPAPKPKTPARAKSEASSVLYGSLSDSASSVADNPKERYVQEWLQGVQAPGPGISALHHLKPLELPKFDGTTKMFTRFKQQFNRLVGDDQQASDEYKLARLKEAVSGSGAADIIGEMFDEPGAYPAAWQELERWYGGSDRHLALQEKEILNHIRITSERDQEALRKFAIKLRNVIVNLELAGEKAGRELFISAMEKLPRALVVRFYEGHTDDECNAKTLSLWLIKRMQNAKRADDIIGQPDATKRTAPIPRIKSHATYTVDAKETKSANACPKCSRSHRLPECAEFKAMANRKKWDFVKTHRLCSACLATGHWARDCDTQKPCKQCEDRHHSVLHYEKGKSQERKGATATARQPETAGTQPAAPTAEECACAQIPQRTCLPSSFMMVPVTLIGPTGKTATCVAMFDSCSTASYVREDVAHHLGLRGEQKRLTTYLLGGKKTTVNSELVDINVQSADAAFKYQMKAYVLESVTATAEVIDWNQHKSAWQHLQSIDFPKLTGKRVDMLIGLNALDLQVSLEERCGGPGEPIARRTRLGWVCMSSPNDPPADAEVHTATAMATMATDDEHLADVVKNFWDVEAVGIRHGQQYLTPAEKTAEKIVAESISFEDGRVTAGIPWNTGTGKPDISNNRRMAENRLQSLQRTLGKQPKLKESYQAVIDGHLRKGYIRPVTEAEVERDGDDQWFLPHFAIIREDKSTTKVRVVFDAAAQQQGKSINDSMYPGPALQNDLVKVLLRFCSEPVALTADISEMFLQVNLLKKDRRYHRFIWNSQVYEFQRLVFGIKASPYLACKALQVVRQHLGDRYECIDVLDKGMYVDDLLHSVATVPEAKRTQQSVQTVLSKGGFHIRKWLSNSVSVMETIPEADRAPEFTISISDHDHGSLPSVKTLGVTWSAEEDVFTFLYKAPAQPKSTKRGILSKMASLFDPRGQLAPFTIRSRVLFQEICILGKSWDEPLDPSHLKQWNIWFGELSLLSLVRVPRCFKCPERDPSTANLTLHVFTDASDAAYAANVYVRAEYPDGAVRVTLAMSKARPCPIKKMSIPKLELKGAVLGVCLAKTVNEALGLSIDQVTYWTDSMNVLYWVRSHSRKFRTDIGNRIAEIHEGSTGVQWYHVPGKLNPADKATRGLTAEQLAEDKVWWCGPEYLAEPSAAWPSRSIIVPTELPGMVKRAHAMAFLTHVPSTSRLHPDHFSSWQRLNRVTALCNRFIANCRRAASTRGEMCRGALTPAEISSAENFWIADAQKECYPATYAAVFAGKPLSPSDPLLSLQPIADHESGVLRVGGRLQTASHLPMTTRHPIILPQKATITKLIVDAEDRRCDHCVGPNHILANLMEKYWLVRGKVVTRHHRAHCVMCRRKWAALASQKTAPLPEFRTAPPLRAFSRVGIDYAGPFLTKAGRGRTQFKRYMCVITCLQTRACHLEMAYALDTESFLLAFTRFCKRRGTPSEVISDNGTNFVGAERELKEAVQALNNNRVAEGMTTKGITWKFNPPLAPHFGGVFECMVKAAKRAMMSTLSQANLTDEELLTAIVQAESMINSRPITSVSADAQDEQPLTPAHFLIGSCNVTLPLEEAEDAERHVSPHRRWRYVQQLLRDVWRRWIREFVPKLNKLTQWKQQRRNLKPGDVVLCVDKKVPRGRWPLCKVNAVYPGADGLVRVVDVKSGQRIIKRPVHQLVPLDVQISG